MDESNREFLETHGPAPAGDLPERVGMTSPVRLFRFHGGRDGGIDAVDQVTGVYYLPEHDPSDVVRAFVEANPELLAPGVVGEVRRKLADRGPEWAAAVETAFQRDAVTPTAG